MDGDKTTVFHDIDGSVSEYPGAFLVKEDNWLLRHPDCIDVPDWKAAICSGHYAQVAKVTFTDQPLHSTMNAFIDMHSLICIH